MRFCEQCGAPVDDDARFCSSCGKSILPPRKVQFAKNAAGNDNSSQAVLREQPIEAGAAKPVKPRKKVNIAVLSIAIAMILLFGTLFVYSGLTLLQRRDDEAKMALSRLHVDSDEEESEDEEEAPAETETQPVESVAAVTPAPTPTPVVVASPEITDLSQTKIPVEGILVFSGHTYQFVDQGVDWEKAKTICEKLGGYLATVDTEEEMRFLACNMPNDRKNLYWIGMNCVEIPGTWKWLTPSGTGYSNWAANGANAASMYVQMFAEKQDITTKIGSWISSANTVSGGTFFDTEKVGFLCEWSASALPADALVGNDPNNMPLSEGVDDIDGSGSISEYEQLLPYFNSDGFIFGDSSRRYLSMDELTALISPDSPNYDVDSMLFLLGFARNEIYARNGGLFESERYGTHFTRYQWYNDMPKTEVSFDMMNEYEQENIRLIKEAEKYYKELQ